MDMKRLSAWQILGCLCALLFAGAVQSAEAMDELSKKVAAYELSMPRIESYGALMSELTAWADTKPAEARALNNRAPKGGASFSANVAFVMKEPVLADLCKRHHLTGEDYILIPAATMQASIAMLGVAQGRSFPADRINPKNIALVQANTARVDAIMSKVRADQARNRAQFE